MGEREHRVFLNHCRIGSWDIVIELCVSVRDY